MTTLAQKLDLHFTSLLNDLPDLPPAVEWLLPLKNMPETAHVFRLFLDRFYSDEQPRTLILGINPGRFGAGVTNVAFTDPAHLARVCGIENSFQKREELSAQFVYRVIFEYGGVETFYKAFFINSIVPFGFVKKGNNYNYYDEKPLQTAVEPFAERHLRGLLDLGMNRRVCICLGEGKNFQFFSKMNEKKGFFEKIIPLPHPRFVMQYRRKQVDTFVKMYLQALNQVRCISAM